MFRHNTGFLILLCFLNKNENYVQDVPPKRENALCRMLHSYSEALHRGT
jgi:hypothetical protein